MIPASAVSERLAQRDREEIARRRQKSEARLARERARNARLALVCYVVLAVGLASAHYFGWLPGLFNSHLSSEDAAAKRFSETRTGQVLFTSADGAICRELKFNNDTGRFSNGRVTRCDALSESEEPPTATPGGRLLSIREGFSKR
jgi:hypothetical protein